MDWKHLLAYITGTVDQELLLRNEYLVTENRILRHQIKGRVCLRDDERKTLAAIGKQLSKQALAEVASLVTPDTILAWHRKLVAQKFDGSRQRKVQGALALIKSWRRWWCAWRKTIARGARIASWGHWPTWAIRSVTRPWATSSSAMVSRQRQSARPRPPGRSSFVGTWTSSWRLTSSPLRCGRWAGS